MSQSVQEILEELVPGDIVRVTRTQRVAAVDADEVRFDDVGGSDPGVIFYEKFDEIHGSLKLEVVKRVNRKPAVGDVVDSQKLVDTRWKRGTTVKSRSAVNWTLVLTPEGEWFAPQTGSRFSFDEIRAELAVGNSAEFDVIYLPE